MNTDSNSGSKPLAPKVRTELQYVFPSVIDETGVKRRYDPIVYDWPHRPFFSVPWLTVKWGVMPRFLHGEIKTGRLQAGRNGRHYRISREAAIQYEQTYVTGLQLAPNAHT